MRKLFVLALLLVPLARADTVFTNSTIAFTPLGDPLTLPGEGRVAVIYNEPFFNESVFFVRDRDPFLYTRSLNTLTFLPGTYDNFGTETLTISTVGQQVDFLFQQFDFPYLDSPGQIVSFDWMLPGTVVPTLNSAGIEGDRFYVDGVDIHRDIQPFSTPEPSAFILLLLGLATVIVCKPKRRTA